MFRAFRFDLHPTAEQEEVLRQTVGVCRLVYNLALEQRRDFWRQYRAAEGRGISWPSQSLELTALRAEFDWIAAVNRSAQEQALRDLDRAFGSFFAGRASFPSPRRRGVNDSFRMQAKDCGLRQLNAKWSEVRIPGVGWVKLRSTRAVVGVPKNVTVQFAVGRWSVSVATTQPASEAVHAGPAVGIDRGIAQTLALSTGEVHQMPPSVRTLARRAAKAQRVLCRRKRGSRRRARQLQRVARLRARVARVRRDFHHKAALSIAERFSAVAIEALRTRGMTASARGTADAPGRNVRQKAGLNRAILEQGWASFARILAYKLEERGGVLVEVPAAYTSQTCSKCGVIDARSRESQAVFRCVTCGHEANADVNAALEIRRRHAALLDGEGGHRSPREPSTVSPLAA